MLRRQFGLVGLVVTVLLVVAACGGSSDSEPAAPRESADAVEEPAEEASATGSAESADFDTALREASNRTEAAMDEVFDALDQLEPNAPPPTGFFAETFSSAKEVVDDYAEELKALAAPEEYRADRDRHVSALIELSTYFEEIVAADEASDPARVNELLRKVDSSLRNLAAGVSPEYAALAFISPQALGTDLFVGLSSEETAYLDGVTAAVLEFERRAFQFGAAISRQYTSVEALLQALYEAGAGTAFEAVQEVAVTLEPPPRFEADHERFLSLLEEQVRLDRLVGQAARDGDIVAFELNNHLLGLAGSRAALDYSPEFAATVTPVSVPDGFFALELDPESSIAETRYGPGLFQALKTFRTLFEPGGRYVFFPQTPDDAVLEVIPELATLYIRIVADGRESIDALTPPEEYSDDQTRILEYFDELLENQEAILAAATAGDIDAARDAIDATSDSYCDAASELSADVEAATDIYFGEESGQASFCSP